VQLDHVLQMYHVGYHKGHRPSSIREPPVESATSITVQQILVATASCARPGSTIFRPHRPHSPQAPAPSCRCLTTTSSRTSAFTLPHSCKRPVLYPPHPPTTTYSFFHPLSISPPQMPCRSSRGSTNWRRWYSAAPSRRGRSCGARFRVPLALATRTPRARPPRRPPMTRSMASGR